MFVCTSDFLSLAFFYEYWNFGSGALSGLMLDPGLLKISFFLLLAPVGSSNPAGHYPIPFPNPAGQS